MQPLRESLRRLLDAHQPNPALIVDGLWNLIETQPGRFLALGRRRPCPAGTADQRAPPGGASRRLAADLFDDGGLQHTADPSAQAQEPRQRRRGARRAVDELESYLPAEPPDGSVHQPVVSLDLQTRLGDVRLFMAIATLGAPLEVTAANLAIETFLPMDTRERDAAAGTGEVAGPGHCGAGLSANAAGRG
jgi:hypothetical protein